MPLSTPSQHNPSLYQMLVEGVRDAVYLHDVEGRILEVNPAATDQTGYSRDELLQMLIHTLNPYRDAKAFKSMLDEMLEQGLSHKTIYSTHRQANGREIPIEVNLNRLDHGSEILFVAAIRDISEHERLKLSVEHKVRFNQLLLDISSRLVNLDPERIDGAIDDVLADIGQFFSVDRSYVFSIDWDNDSITNTHEWTGKDVPPAIHRLQNVAFSDFPWLKKLMERLQVAHAPDVSELPEEARKDREEYQQQKIRSLIIVPIIRDGRAVGMFGLDAVRQKGHWDKDIRDNLRLLAQLLSSAMDAARLGRELTHMAYHDALTQLPNRKLLHDRFALAAERARRNGHKVAVLLLDIDDFKLVNDTLTHSSGDKLLCVIAERLKKMIRGSDTVARLGGDEFVMVCELKSGEDAAALAERTIESISAPVMIERQRIIIHASIGISLMPDDQAGCDKMLRNADIAMYEAKAAGKNRFAFYDASMGESVRVLIEMRYDLQQAIDNDQLIVHYQPLCCAQTDRLSGFEALVRWQHPIKGLMMPAAFLPVAERSDLICRLDRWVMQQACTDAKELCGDNAEMRIGINLSTRDLYDRYVVDRFVETARAFGPSIDRRIQLEITESMLMQDVHTAIDHLNLFKKFLPRVSIAIDDFGSGYSSLNYLRRLPIDTLKIDRAFTADLLDDRRSAKAIIRSIMDLARNLGLKVIAEGVETQEQYRLFKSLGCDQIQGYYIGKPQPLSQAMKSVPPWLEV
ncbi:EAL domain-containing protein [Wenzhouxiangella sp. XN201]|uniref:sensor domain-containing protein n=1 Tax=Wenzhouxiangella sp. XN201 TaxID=2710755 RepID=UPI0013CDCC03|nr:EAL domain-containing protein [Wenzhouxiangella sp. XN201]NEZ04622.1 EAL domain-containing protein [Wenzhouxiangella sp. XN201]